MEAISIRPVGLARTPYRSPAEAPIQGHFRPEVRGEVEVFEEFAPALADVDGFSHLTLLYYFHQAGEERLTVKPYLDDVARGVFATRAEYRPNPIAITTCKMLCIDEHAGVIQIADIDALDGTPVVDLKPYYPVCDRVQEARIPEWLSDWPEWMPEEGLGL